MPYKGSLLVLLVDVLATISSCSMFLWVSYKILTPKKQGRFFTPSVIIIIAGYELAIQSLEFFQENNSFLILNILLGFFSQLIYCLLFLKGRIIHKLLISVITSLVLDIISNAFVVFWMLLGFSVDSMQDSVAIYASTTIIVHILLFLVYVLMVKAYKKITVILKGTEAIKVTAISVLTFIFIITSLQTTNIVRDSRIRTFTLISTLCFILSCIIMFQIIYTISKNNCIEQENTLLKMEKEYQYQKYEDIIRQSEQMKKLRHDYKNNFLVLRSLIDGGKNKKAIELINKEIDQINASRSHIRTNNDVVNAIINTKISSANDNGIKVSCVSISDFDGIDDFDLCNLIGNMFDNAITAVENCREKIIDIQISKRSNCYIFKMSNTVSDPVLDENPHLFTTKDDKTFHGYGMKIIKDITDSYSGDLDYYEVDGIFYVIAHLALKPIIK